MRFTPDFPARTARQKASLPIPFGLTAPIPVITTRGIMVDVRYVMMQFARIARGDLVFIPFDLAIGSCQFPQFSAPRSTHVSASRLAATEAGGIIIQMPLGLYISVPFCKTKCSYCNFASDVFSRAVFEKYVAAVCAEIEQAAPNCSTRWAVRSTAPSTQFIWAAVLPRFWMLHSWNASLSPFGKISLCRPQPKSQSNAPRDFDFVWPR